jgi:hypothetical protein
MSTTTIIMTTAMTAIAAPTDIRSLQALRAINADA